MSRAGQRIAQSEPGESVPTLKVGVRGGETEQGPLASGENILRGMVDGILEKRRIMGEEEAGAAGLRGLECKFRTQMGFCRQEGSSRGLVVFVFLLSQFSVYLIIQYIRTCIKHAKDSTVYKM